MRQLVRRAALVLVELFCLTVLVLAQQTSSEPVVVSLPGGGFAAFRIEVASTVSDASRSRGWTRLDQRVAVDDSNSTVHRMLLDNAGSVVFAYDLVFRFNAASRQFDLFAQPMTRHSQEKLNIRIQGSPVLTIPGPTKAQLIQDGETLAMDLLVNESLGIKVIDYIKVASQERLLIRPESLPSKDFGLANVELTIANSSLNINQYPIITSARRNCRGSLIWLFVPGEGRFIFSLIPYQGYDFKKIAVLDDRTISFRWNNSTYEWKSSRAILGIAGRWNMWVLHDPDFVDLFAPTDAGSNLSTTRPKLFEKPWSLSVMFGSPRKDEHASHPNDQPRKPISVRVLVGGSNSLETLVLKK